jgi:DNA-binding transcriptional MerR regulator
MFRVGQFSKMSQVSVRMLRHYDELGLVKPARVDDFTGYRYYSTSQLPRLNRLRALRDMGLSLEQIGQLLDNDITPEQLKGMLRLKKVELEQKISEGQEQLVRVKAWLKQLERKAEMSKYQVVVKQIALLRVASLRDVTPTYYEAADLSNELLAYMAEHGVAPAGNIVIVYFTGGEDKEFEVDQEVCFPIEGELPESSRVKVHELPAIETAATLIHQGPWEGLVESYQTLGTWIETNGYQIAGPNRDYFLQGGEKADTGDYMCELVFPVRR